MTLICLFTALSFTACDSSKTMTKSEVIKWKKKHPFNSLPKDIVIVDENGDPINLK